MIMVLTAIALFLGLTLLAYLVAVALRALLSRDRPTAGTGRGVIDGIATLAEMLSHVDFDPPDLS